MFTQIEITQNLLVETLFQRVFHQKYIVYQLVQLVCVDKHAFFFKQRVFT